MSANLNQPVFPLKNEQIGYLNPVKPPTLLLLFGAFVLLALISIYVYFLTKKQTKTIFTHSKQKYNVRFYTIINEKKYYMKNTLVYSQYGTLPATYPKELNSNEPYPVLTNTPIPDAAAEKQPRVTNYLTLDTIPGKTTEVNSPDWIVTFDGVNVIFQSEVKSLPYSYGIGSVPSNDLYITGCRGGVGSFALDVYVQVFEMSMNYTDITSETPVYVISKCGETYTNPDTYQAIGRTYKLGKNANYDSNCTLNDPALCGYNLKVAWNSPTIYGVYMTGFYKPINSGGGMVGPPTTSTATETINGIQVVSEVPTNTSAGIPHFTNNLSANYITGKPMNYNKDSFTADSFGVPNDPKYAANEPFSSNKWYFELSPTQTV
jgi:hypothetical protein